MKQFSTRRIILLFLSELLVLLVILVFFTSYLSTRKTGIFMQSHEEQLRKGLENVLALKRTGIKQGVVDYAHWDEFVYFMLHGNRSWAEHFLPPILHNYHTDELQVYSPERKFIFSAVRPEHKTLQRITLPSSFFDSLSVNGSFGDVMSIDSTIVELFGATIQYTNPSDRNGRSFGYFVVAKVWDAAFYNDIAGIVGGKIFVCNDGTPTTDQSTGIIQIKVPVINSANRAISSLCVRKEFPFLKEYRRYSSNLIHIIVLSSLVILFTLFFMISHWITRPLKIVGEAIANEDADKAQLLSSYGRDFSRIGDSLRSYIEQKHSLVNLKEKAEESDKLKSAFLSNMSHQIRTPLNGIMGFTELLRKRIPSDESTQRYGEIINGCSRDLIKIVSDLIDIAKLESGQFSLHITKFTLATAFSNLELLYPLTKTGPEVKLVVTHPPVEESVFADMVKVQQVMHNLLDNAIKFTMRGVIEAGWNTSEGNIIFYVKDTGIGIPTKEQPKVFTRFTQFYNKGEWQFSGAGLGLAISKALMEMMGGRLWFESVEGIGSTFFFSLPICNPEEELTK